MNRAEYLATSNEPGTFRAYYSQFVNERTRNYVACCIGRDAIIASTDEHLNDIALGLWDDIIGGTPLAIKFSDVGDYGTLAGLVCVLKEAARQIRDSSKGEQS